MQETLLFLTLVVLCQSSPNQNPTQTLMGGGSKLNLETSIWKIEVFPLSKTFGFCIVWAAAFGFDRFLPLGLTALIQQKGPFLSLIQGCHSLLNSWNVVLCWQTIWLKIVSAPFRAHTKESWSWSWAEKKNGGKISAKMRRSLNLSYGCTTLLFAPAIFFVFCYFSSFSKSSSCHSSHSKFCSFKLSFLKKEIPKRKQPICQKLKRVKSNTTQY